LETFFVFWSNHACGALNSAFSAMNYAEKRNEILQKCNEILHFRKIKKRQKTSWNVERSKNQGQNVTTE
jgi:hypothetical protein